MLAEKRWWSTADGRLVEDGHVDAAVLAYAAGDVIAPADEDLVKAPEKPRARKSTEKPKR